MTHSRQSLWITSILISTLVASPALGQDPPSSPAAAKPAAPVAAETAKPVPPPPKVVQDQKEEEEEHKLVGLRVNLLPLVAGFLVGKSGIYSFGTEVRIIDELSAGPNIAFANLKIDGKTVSTFSYGARVNWYMSGKAVGRGWYLSPYFTIVPLKASSVVNQSGFDVPVEAKYSASIVGATVGYQWMWDFGMTFNVGLGAFHMNMPTSLTLTGTDPLGNPASQVFDLQQAVASIPAVLPEIEISFGFAF